MANPEKDVPQYVEQTRMQQGRTSGVLAPFSANIVSLVYTLEEKDKEIGEFVGGETYFIDGLTTIMLEQFEIKQIGPIMENLNTYILKLKEVKPAPFENNPFETLDKWDFLKIEACFRFRNKFGKNIHNMHQLAFRNRLFIGDQLQELTHNHDNIQRMLADGNTDGTNPMDSEMYLEILEHISQEITDPD